MRIFGWSADPGTAYWRLHVPLGELAARGHDVMVSDTMPPCVQFDAEADVVVGSRVSNAGASETFQRLAAERRMLVVYETDDDTFSITPDNRPAHLHFHEREDGANLRRISANLAAAHLVTTTNEHLAGALRQHTDAPIVLLPNRVPRWLTERPAPWERPGGRLVVGHTGGASHVRDFGEVAKSLRSWLQKHGDRAEFHGCGVDLTPRVATIRGRTRHTGWTKDVPTYLRSIDFDIGLAPLRDTVFNRSKTPLKAMEYGALGIPVLASDVEPYRSYVRHGETGFLCSTAKDWTTALEALRDPELRHRMGLAGRIQACEHLANDHADEWLAVYSTDYQLTSKNLIPSAR